MKIIEPIPVRLLIEEIGTIAPLGVLLTRLKDYPDSFVLGDFATNGPGRYSYLGLEPSELVSLAEGEEKKPLGILDTAWRRYRLANEEPMPVPFVGGWVGYLSYDLGRYIERLPDGVAHDMPLGLLRFGFYDTVLAWDAQAQCGYLLALEYIGQKSSAGVRLRQLGRLCKDTPHSERKNHFTPLPESALLPTPPPGSESTPLAAPGAVPAETTQLLKAMQPNIEHSDYLNKVARAREYILAGDIFEVNLSQRFSYRYNADPDRLYEYLANHNCAGYAALLRGNGHAVVSSSPELFLSKRGTQIVTQPIKGTIPRGGNRQQDQTNRTRLEQSEKDRAELNMIIDLERNDLGRICRYGSVRVVRERVIEAHPTVFHAVATVAGELRPKVGLMDILRATFPGGSISGAPKIRAMQIIDELEPTARSVYTGSIGWIGVNGDMELNIAIRTIVLAEGWAYVQVGGAVVADSEPQAEYDETIAKAAALVRALAATTSSPG